jgi:hypothetical protein
MGGLVFTDDEYDTEKGSEKGVSQKRGQSEKGSVLDIDT